MPFIFNSHRFSSPAVVTDTDVIAYMTATGIPNDGTVYYGGNIFTSLTGSQMWYNVNELITGLKADGVYSHLIALWLQIGDTESTQKWNAIDPTDSDGAHRLTYHGTDGYVDRNGCHFVKTNWIDSHFAPTTIVDGFFIGITQRNNKSGVAFGTVLGPGSLCRLDFENKAVYNGWVFPETFTTEDTQMQLVLDRPDIHQYNLYIDGVAHNKVEDLWLTPLGADSFYFGANNDVGGSGPQFLSEANFSTMFAGITMDATKHLALKNRLYTFNYNMKRVQRNAYFFGDSITQGDNSLPTPLTLRWSKLVSTSLSLNEINHGLSGRVLTETTPTPFPPSMYLNSTNAVPTKKVNDKYIFIAYGVNDARYLITFGYPNYTTALFTTQLQDVIDNIIAKGWSASDIVFVTGYRTADTFTSQYANLVAATISVGGANGCQVIDLSGLTYTAGDGIHPDNDGHNEIAAYIPSQIV